MKQLYGGIEGGGTKFLCTIGSNPKDIQEPVVIPTTTPQETIQKVVNFFQQQQKELGPILALGVGCFGPLDLNIDSKTYGYITTTPKSGWQNIDLVGHLESALQVPTKLETDTNAAALGEWKWGAAKGLDTFIYLTIGTGIGGGGLFNGKLMHGSMHPEMGHIFLPRNPKDFFEGACPYHKDCLEGMASGLAMNKRWKQRAETLDSEHLAWDIEAYYLAMAIANFICTLSPQKVILGGGIMQQLHLFPKIRAKVIDMLHHYIQIPAILDKIESYIVPPDLGSKAGILGSIALAQL